MTLSKILTIMIGGGVGAVCRALLAYLIGPITVGGIPCAIMIVNILGCGLMGAVWAWLGKFPQMSVLSPIVVTGFLGGFTTFSAFALETGVLGFGQEYGSALLYILITNVACLAAFGAAYVFFR